MSTDFENSISVPSINITNANISEGDISLYSTSGNLYLDNNTGEFLFNESQIVTSGTFSSFASGNLNLYQEGSSLYYNNSLIATSGNLASLVNNDPNINLGGGGGGGGGAGAGLPTDATVSVNIYPLVDTTDITVLTITVAGNFLSSVDASDNDQNISVTKFDIVDEAEAATLTRVNAAGDTPAANDFLVHDDILYYVTNESEPACIPSAAAGATLYTDYNTSIPSVVNFSSVNLTVSEDGSNTGAILKAHLPSGPVKFTEPGLNLIDLDYKSRLSTYYHEISYTVDGDVDTIDVWLNNTKTTKLFTKAFTYTNGDLTQILITDVVTGATLTKALVYDVNGNLETITRTYA